MTPREQQFFELGNNFPGLLTDSELEEWQRLRDRHESQPSDQEQEKWSQIAILIIMVSAAYVIAII